MADLFNGDEQEISLEAALKLIVESFCMVVDYLIHINHPMTEKDLHLLNEIVQTYYAKHITVKRLHGSLSALQRAKLAELTKQASKNYNIVPFNPQDAKEPE